MGLFSGPRRPEPVEAEDRSFTLPSTWPTYIGDFASLNPADALTAKQSVAIGTTQDLIASLTSELPVQTFNASGKEITTPENVLDPGGDGLGVEDWVYRLLDSYLTAGNLYGAALSFGGGGRYMTNMELFNPADVSLSLTDGKVQWRICGRPVEDQSQFIHRRSRPVPGRVLGLSPIEQHATQIGVSLSASRFGRQWFTDGAHPSGMLTNNKPLSNRAAEDAKTRIMDRQQGSREPIVMGEGWDYKVIQISPEESQFLETSGYTEAQCARIYGPGFAEILGYPSGSTMTYANVVDRRQDLLVFSLNRWIRRAERALSMLTPRPQYVKFNRDALLEATTLQRYQAHALATWRTVNETRVIENLEPIEGGDVLPSATTPPTPQQGGTP